MASEPKIRYGPKPTTVGQQQVVIRDYGGYQVYDSQPPNVEEDDPPTSERARAHGLRRIKRRHFAEHVATEHERLRSAVVEAALADRRAEESRYGDNRDIDNLIATRRAFRLAVTELVEFEASHAIGQKDG